tara:strand:- start:215 stop:412 length:198 start_codon:yes stop_codon:yes gene_type:complete
MPKIVPMKNIVNAPFAMATSPPNFHLMARTILITGIPIGVIIANRTKFKFFENRGTQDITMTRKL